MALRILLADDHTVVRDGLRSYLEQHGFAIVGEAADGHEAVRMAAELRPDVAMLDLSMPLLNGLDASRAILRANSQIKVILLTVHSEEQYVLEALQAGITGYVLKTQAAADLVQALHEVSKGCTYLSPKVSRAVVQAYLDRTHASDSSRHDPDPLTARERQVLQLIAEGKTTKEVATVLGLRVKTAASHRTKIMEKLAMHGTAGLVRYAIRRGLIQP